MSTPTRYKETRSVRFSDCDAQGVVYNANYLRLIDDAFDTLLRSRGLFPAGSDWDLMVRRVDISWTSPLSVGETFEIEFFVSRFGVTSFDVEYRGRAVLPHPPLRGEGSTLDGYPRELFVATAYYVGIDPATKRSAPMPTWLMEELSSAD